MVIKIHKQAFSPLPQDNIVRIVVRRAKKQEVFDMPASEELAMDIIDTLYDSISYAGTEGYENVKVVDLTTDGKRKKRRV